MLEAANRIRALEEAAERFTEEVKRAAAGRLTETPHSAIERLKPRPARPSDQ